MDINTDKYSSPVICQLNDPHFCHPTIPMILSFNRDKGEQTNNILNVKNDDVS